MRTIRRLFSLWFLFALSVLRGAAVEIRTSDLPWAVVNTGYRSLIETGIDARCPDGDVSVVLHDGSLPRGVEIRAGYLSGTPKETGRFQFSVRATNNCSSLVKALELIVTGKPILRVFPEELTCEYRAGATSPGQLTVQVSASWPDLPYSVRIDAPWLAGKVRTGATPATGSGLDSDAVSLEIDPKSLAPGTYRTSVRFSTWLGANSPVVSITLKVVAAE
jgi:hypothetical protein